MSKYVNNVSMSVLAQTVPTCDWGCGYKCSRCIFGRGSGWASVTGDETNLDESFDGEQGCWGFARTTRTPISTSAFGEQSKGKRIKDPRVLRIVRKYYDWLQLNEVHLIAFFPLSITRWVTGVLTVKGIKLILPMRKSLIRIIWTKYHF